MPLILPASIENDTAADAAEVQNNFVYIQTYVNTNLLNRDGSVALTAPLLLPGDPTQENHAANKGYVDAEIDDVVARAGDTMIGDLTMAVGSHVSGAAAPTDQYHMTNKTYVDGTTVARAGDTMTGDLTMASGSNVSQAAAPSNVNHLTNKTYVDGQRDTRVATVGDTMTGDLTMAGGSVIICAATPTNNNHLTRRGYVDGAHTMTGDLTMGAAPGGSDEGMRLRTDGALITSVTTGDEDSIPNIELFRGGVDPNNIGGVYIRFMSGTTQIGRIEIGPGSDEIRLVSTSDYRLKNELGPVADPVGRLERLRPLRFARKVDGTEADGFLAHEVAEVVPEAVTGEKDAVNDNQMLDTTRLIPLLVAAVQQLTARVAELETA